MTVLTMTRALVMMLGALGVALWLFAAVNPWPVSAAPTSVIVDTSHIMISLARAKPPPPNNVRSQKE